MIGGGYARVGGSAEGVTGIGDFSVDGYDIRLGSGIDYYFSNVFSLGATIQLELVRLWRNGTTITPPSDPMTPAPPASFAEDASGHGIAFNAGVVAGLHF
jgi:hypothetical protein